MIEVIQIFPRITRMELDEEFRIEPHEEWALGVIRQERNRLLAESDWRVLPDSPVTNKLEWYEYRQQLRDLPEIAVSNNFVNTPWPETPLDS